MNILDELGRRILFFDGGLGSLLQERGLEPGELPETWNLTRPEILIDIHKAYINAGADIINANTFGANRFKFDNLEEIITAGIANAKKAVAETGKKAYVALDIGSCGKLLKPMGTLDFADAVDVFAEIVRIGDKAGADLILIETMSDTYEIKAAVLAAKENTKLPVFVTAIFDERKKLLTGADIPVFVSMLEGLRVDALGINCGLGPKQMFPMLEELQKYSSLPIVVKPNAGLPKQRGNETYYDDEPEVKKHRKKSDKPEKKKKRGGHGLTIVMLLMGVVILIAIILVAGKASGLIGSNNDTDKKTEAQDTSESDDDGMVTVPNLVGKTEDEAKNITKDMKLGIQPMGEEASNQAKGTISSQDIPKGSKVEQYTTIKYYISKGAQKITIPDVDGQTGVDAQQTLEDMGLTVEIQKEYSELNDDGTPVTDPGYAVSTTPAAGNSVSAGDSVTLLVSRGVDYGDSVEVPSVVGMTKNDAVTTFGKFLNVEVKEEKSTEVAEGEVISQEPEAGNWEDPDNVNVVITVSTGDQEPSAQSDSADTAASSDAPAQTADNSAAAAAGEVWKCTQTLNTPSGYSGGPVRLELIQNVNGTPTASVVLEDQVIQFPYDLDITGAPGISEGTLYLSEQISGTYQELGNYSITFAKAE